MSASRASGGTTGTARTIPAACPVCHGSRYTLRVEPVMTMLCGAGRDFAREPCERCDASGATPAGQADPLDPTYRVALPPHPDLLVGCGNDAISGEIG